MSSYLLPLRGVKEGLLLDDRTHRLVLYTDLVKGAEFTFGETSIVSGSLGSIIRSLNALSVPEELPRSLAHSSDVNGISLSPDGLRVVRVQALSPQFPWPTTYAATCARAMSVCAMFARAIITTILIVPTRATRTLSRVSRDSLLNRVSFTHLFINP